MQSTNRRLAKVLDPSSRATAKREKIDGYREMAVALIGDALLDLLPMDKKYKLGRINSAARWEREYARARAFFDSIDLDFWAQATDMSAAAWRRIAKGVANDRK